MSDVAMPAAAPVSAPSAPSAPTTQTLGVPPTSDTPAPPSGEQAPAPTRSPVPYKAKVRLDDLNEERELEVDVAPFLETYKRKVKLDGREFEVPVEEAFKSYERVRSSMSRFDEAAKMRKEAESKLTQMQEREKAIDAALRDPRRALDVVQRAMGEDAFNTAIVERVKAMLEYEQLPPEQRQHRDQMTAAERKLAEREAEIAKRDRQIAEREKALATEREQRVERLAQERQKAIIAEWVPALEAAGLPAKLNGQPNTRMIQMLADTMVRAKRAGMPMTLSEGITTVKEEFEAMVGTTLAQRQQAAMQAALEQPGRGEPIATTPRSTPKRYESTEDLERSLMGSWQRRR